MRDARAESGGLRASVMPAMNRNGRESAYYRLVAEQCIILVHRVAGVGCGTPEARGCIEVVRCEGGGGARCAQSQMGADWRESRDNSCLLREPRRWAMRRDRRVVCPEVCRVGAAQSRGKCRGPGEV
jgi:hypothetical protein